MDETDKLDDIPYFVPVEVTKYTLKELLPFLFEEILNDLDLARKALRDQNLDEVCLLMHKTKGTASGYGIKRIHDYCLRMEKDLKAGVEFDVVSKLLKLEEIILATKKFAESDL